MGSWDQDPRKGTTDRVVHFLILILAIVLGIPCCIFFVLVVVAGEVAVYGFPYISILLSVVGVFLLVGTIILKGTAKRSKEQVRTEVHKRSMPKHPESFPNDVGVCNECGTGKQLLTSEKALYKFICYKCGATTELPCQENET